MLKSNGAALPPSRKPNSTTTQHPRPGGMSLSNRWKNLRYRGVLPNHVIGSILDTVPDSLDPKLSLQINLAGEQLKVGIRAAALANSTTVTLDRNAFEVFTKGCAQISRDLGLWIAIAADQDETMKRTFGILIEMSKMSPNDAHATLREFVESLKKR